MIAAREWLDQGVSFPRSRSTRNFRDYALDKIWRGLHEGSMGPLRKIIGTFVFETALIGGGGAAEVMLSQIPGWGWLAYSIIAGIVSIPLIWGDEIKRWWIRRRVAALAARAEALPSTAIRGIRELERCHQSLTKYMAIPGGRMVKPAEISGSAELYPYMTDLCRILDEQDIPHPEIDYSGFTIVGTKKWAMFLGDLWAARHNIERARRVYQGDRT